MAQQNDIKRYINVLEKKDLNGEKYFFTIVAKTSEGTEIELISHLDNRNATGASEFEQLADLAKKDNYDFIEVFLYTSFSANSVGAKKSISKTRLQIKPNKVVVSKKDTAVEDTFRPFGGLGGFLEQQQAIARVNAEHAFQRKEIEFKEKEIADLRAKLGDLEAKQKEHDKVVSGLEIEKQKAENRSGILEVLGNVLADKGLELLNSPAQLQGLGAAPQQQSTVQEVKSNEPKAESTIQEVPENPIQAEIIKWVSSQNNEEVLVKLFQIIQFIASDIENLNTIHSLTQN